MRYVSYIIIGILIIIFFTRLNFYDTSIEPANYLLRSLYHANIEHLAANAISFYGLSFLEEVIGSKQFLFAILFIWIVSSLLLYGIHRFIPSRKVYTVGFSGVIFGLIVVYIAVMYRSIKIPLAGLVISILPQLFVPGISFDGHLAGIVAGLIFVLLFRPKGNIIDLQ